MMTTQCNTMIDDKEDKSIGSYGLDCKLSDNHEISPNEDSVHNIYKIQDFTSII